MQADNQESPDIGEKALSQKVKPKTCKNEGKDLNLEETDYADTCNLGEGDEDN